MVDHETRMQIATEDQDAISQYVKAIEHHAAAALDGNAESIAWVKAQLRPWVHDPSSQEPAPAMLRVAAAHFLGADALLPVRRAEEFDLPKQLDAANIAYQAVCNGYGDASAPFAERIKQFVRDNWPAGSLSTQSSSIYTCQRVTNGFNWPGGGNEKSHRFFDVSCGTRWMCDFSTTVRITT